MVCDSCGKEVDVLYAKAGKAMCADCRGPKSGLLKGAWRGH